MENEAVETIEPINASINTKTFVCENCGGTMKYDIQSERFRCASCKAEKEIETLTDDIKEYDFAEYKKKEAQALAFNGMSTIQCQNCGREIAFDSEVIATTCPMCGSTQIADIRQSAGIAPEGVVPFKVDKQEAVQKFKVWVKSRWFAPNDFKRKCTEGMLKGMYVPFWTFDSEAIAPYLGRGGKDHRSVDSKGNRRTTTSWQNVSGIVGNNYDDIQICASDKIKDIDGIMPFNTIESTKPYSAAYLSGFYAELYTIKADVGFEQAKKYMEKKQSSQQDTLLRKSKIRLI